MNSKRIKKLIFSLILSFIFCYVLSTPVFANETTIDDPFSVEAKSALALDFETGKILYNQNGETKLEIASLTKLISLYVVQAEIAKGNLSWDEPVTISKAVAELSLIPDLSNIPLIEGQSYSVRELFEAATIVSANAATVALAEKVAGSEFAFVDLMTELLVSWGITNPLIVNASGLNNKDLLGEIYPGSSPTSENKLTAKELALVARNLIRDFPETLNVSSQAVLNYTNRDNQESIMYTTNLLLPGMPLEKLGVDGLKTGTTDLAGPSLVATMQKEGQRVITVLLNANNHDDANARYTETSHLLDYAFNNWEKKEVVTQGKKVATLPAIPVKKSLSKSVDLVAKDSLTLFVPKNEGDSSLDFQVEYLQGKKSLSAPVTAKQEVATVTISYLNDPLGYLEPVSPLTTTLLTRNSVEKANIFQLTWNKIQDFFSNL